MSDLHGLTPSGLDLSTHAAPPQPGGPGRLSLREGAVDAWIGDLTKAEPVSAWESLLAKEELERAARFRFEQDRHRYVYGRGLLRELAAAYLGTNPDQLEFLYGPGGKPGLAPDAAGRQLCFNLSHSGARLLLGFGWNRQVGVDVELMRHDVETRQIGERYFSQEEQKALFSLTPAGQIPAFFRCWTRKEAYVKAVGEGLSLPLSQFDVSLLPGEPATLLATRPDAVEASRWTLRNLDLGPEYAAAVAVEQVNAQK